MDLGKLQDSKMMQLFRQMVESKTIISMQVVGSRFERLTCITDIKDDGKQTHIVVDLPNGFQAAVEKSSVWELCFNFNGPDKLEYIFTTIGGTYSGQDLVLPVPEFVRRLQRRRNFRLLTPPGTRMFFQSKQLKGTLEVINISLGGVFGILRQKEISSSKHPVLKVSQPVFKINIVFPGRMPQDGEIQIQKAEVVRVERDKENYKHRYALEFKHIDKEELQKLVEIIYQLQREYLQRR